jgi:limonene-1,2-epoxide hydrolase
MADYQRLSVNINNETADVLRRYTAEHHVSTTEAVRRAIGLLNYFEDARKNDVRIMAQAANGERSTLAFL